MERSNANPKPRPDPRKSGADFFISREYIQKSLEKQFIEAQNLIRKVINIPTVLDDEYCKLTDVFTKMDVELENIDIQFVDNSSQLKIVIKDYCIEIIGNFVLGSGIMATSGVMDINAKITKIEVDIDLIEQWRDSTQHEKIPNIETKNITVTLVEKDIKFTISESCISCFLEPMFNHNICGFQNYILKTIENQLTDNKAKLIKMTDDFVNSFLTKQYPDSLQLPRLPVELSFSTASPVKFHGLSAQIPFDGIFGLSRKSKQSPPSKPKQSLPAHKFLDIKENVLNVADGEHVALCFSENFFHSLLASFIESQHAFTLDLKSQGVGPVSDIKIKLLPYDKLNVKILPYNLIELVTKCEVEVAVPNQGQYLVTVASRSLIKVKDENVGRLTKSDVFEDDLYGSEYDIKKETLGVLTVGLKIEEVYDLKMGGGRDNDPEGMMVQELIRAFLTNMEQDLPIDLSMIQGFTSFVDIKSVAFESRAGKFIKMGFFV